MEELDKRAARLEARVAELLAVVEAQQAVMIIRAPVTCPAAFPEQVASFQAEVLALAPAILDITERIDATVLDAVKAIPSDDEAMTAFEEATGWGVLSCLLGRLGDYLLAAADRNPQGFAPTWYEARRVAEWSAIVADPHADDALRAKSQLCISARGESYDRYLESERAVEDRLRRGLLPEVYERA